MTPKIYNCADLFFLKLFLLIVLLGWITIGAIEGEAADDDVIQSENFDVSNLYAKSYVWMIYANDLNNFNRLNQLNE